MRVERSLLPLVQIFSTTQVHLLPWLHGKQQQQFTWHFEGLSNRLNCLTKGLMLYHLNNNNQVQNNIRCVLHYDLENEDPDPTFE